MARSFPRGLTALLAAICLCLTMVTWQVGSAAGADEDQLRRQKHQLGQSLQDARAHLDSSSARLVKAMAALRAAEQRLSDAKARLAATRVELRKAEELDRRMQAALDRAIERLKRAQAAYEDGERQVAGQRQEVAEWAAHSFQSSDSRMLELRVLLNASSPETLTTQLDAVDSVTDMNTDRFERLQAAEVLLKVERDEVRAAKQIVQRKREAAARNLVRKQALERQAEQETNAVAALVSERQRASRAAEEAKAADLRQIANLESERSRVEAQLVQIARERAAEIRRQRAAAERARREAAARSSRGSERSSGSSAPSTQSGGFLSYPVSGYITSSYGMRFHPILHVWKLHDGTDFGVACGTPVHAAAGGTVLSTYYNAGYGNRVILDHGVQRGVSLSTSYNHLTSFAVSPGEHVSRGELIGYSGTTGYSTGCHLHFMVYVNGATTNPMGWL